MIETVKNADGYIIGYVEWSLLNAQGQFGKEYIYVADVWVHENLRHLGILAKLIDIIYKHPYASNARKVYWDVVRINGKRITDNTLPYFDKFKRQSQIFDKDYIYRKILRKDKANDKRIVPQDIPVPV